jgi:transposase
MHSSGKYWSAEMRYQMVEAVKSGRSPQEVADVTGIPRRTIVDWVTRDKCGFSLENSPKPGQPRLIDEHTVERLCAAVDANPFISNEELVRKYKLSCSPRTVDRALASHDPGPTHGRSRVWTMPTTRPKTWH